MRLAVYSPLPPQRGEVAAYAGSLCAELARSEQVVVVVRDDLVERVPAPEGCTVVAASDHRRSPGEVAFYHMGDDASLHGYMHARALHDPGVLVLHDPSLVSLYLGIGGGPTGTVFLEEARLNRSCPGGEPAGSLTALDPLTINMSRRLVRSSDAVLVTSAWAARVLAERSPGARVVEVPEPVAFPDVADGEPSVAGSGIVGLFGAVDSAARVFAALAAFRELAASSPGGRLLVAVRPSNEAVAAAVHHEVAAAGLGPSVSVDLDVAGADRRAALLASCDAVVALDSQLTGATARTVLEAFASRRVAIVPDAPQYRELDTRFCWRVAEAAGGDAEPLRDAMARAVERPADAREAGAGARRALEQQASFAAVARRHLEIAREVLDRREAAATASPAPARAPSLNAIASWEATTGLAEAARRAVRALRHAGVGVSMDDYDYGAPRVAARWPVDLRALPRGRPHGTDLWFLNLNELHVVPDEYLRPPGHPRRVIASWHWELAGIPEAQRGQVERVDEIWVASRFVAEVFRGYTSRPVHVVPCVVEPEVDGALTRAHFGLPEDRCLFFFNFDASSTLARKNPMAVIEAYRRAFTPGERAGRVGLVMKTMNLARLPEARLVLGEAMAGVGGTVVDADLPPSAVGALTAACDVYVSLHRGEGFGLGIAEAMALGKPAVATAYSGNLDFMDVGNSCPVGYRIVPVDGGQLRFNPDAERVYPPGQLWAEPDVDEAARRMRTLYEHPEMRERLGAAGAATVAERCSAAAVGARMRALLARR